MVKTRFKKLQIMQNDCLRAILGVRRADRVHIVDLQRRCNVPSLQFFLAQCRKRYINQAVRYIVPLRDDAEFALYQAKPYVRGPMSILKRKLELPLPPLAI